MEVVVDGTIYERQSHGGISRLFSEILPRMCDMDDSLRIHMLAERRLRQSLPEHKHIIRRRIPSVSRYLRPRRLWNPILLRLSVGRGEGQIWHSTYYTLPQGWKGLQVVTVADMIYERFASLFGGPGDDRLREQKRRYVQGADRVICISESTRRDAERFYGLDREAICVAPLACSHVFRLLKQRDDELRPRSREPFLLYVGNRAHYKNFERLIQAYAVWPRRKEMVLVIVGQPWSADERQRLVQLGIEDCVHSLTDVDDEALCRLYNWAAAFVYPSLYEGFGIPLLEAMACGCPIVASRIPSTIEVAGECPIYFEATEVDDLVSAFDLALSEGRSSERVGRGLERCKLYSWDQTAARTLAVYSNLC